MSTTREHPVQGASVLPSAEMGGPRAVEIPATPADLRALPATALPGLARTLRRRLVEITSRSGGHLGPNLGRRRADASPCIAEFRSPARGDRLRHRPPGLRPQDAHRARRVPRAPHRRGSRPAIRTGGESAHDRGRELPCLGLDRLGPRHRPGAPPRRRGGCLAVAVIGDGALTGGVGLEALNVLASDTGSRTIVVLNDNTRSYAPTVGGLADHLEELRRGRRSPPGDEMFTSLGLTYLGPVDGHDHVALAQALELAREAAEDPSRSGVLLHVVTRKGAGFARAEDDATDHWHATGPFETPVSRTCSPVMLQCARRLRRRGPPASALRSSTRLAPMTGWSPSARRWSTRWDSTPLQREMPSRVIDVGIAEQLALDTASGLSRGGAKPIVGLYATFLNRAFDQLLLDVALHGEDVTITLDRAGVTGDDGPSHHGIWDLSVAAQIPGLQVWAPRDAARLDAAVASAVAVEGPSLVRYPQGRLSARGPGPRRSSRRGGARRGRRSSDRRLAGPRHRSSGRSRAVEAARVDRRLTQHRGARILSGRCRWRSSCWTWPRRARAVVTLEDGVESAGSGPRSPRPSGIAPRSALRAPGADPRRGRSSSRRQARCDPPAESGAPGTRPRSHPRAIPTRCACSERPPGSDLGAPRRGIVGPCGEDDRFAVGHLQRVLGMRTARAVDGQLRPPVVVVDDADRRWWGSGRVRP